MKISLIYIYTHTATATTTTVITTGQPVPSSDVIQPTMLSDGIQQTSSNGPKVMKTNTEIITTTTNIPSPTRDDLETGVYREVTHTYK